MMPATALSVPTDSTTETVDFLRRLASMMSGGRNAEMLQAAASAIETLSRRASAAEALVHDHQDEHVDPVRRVRSSGGPRSSTLHQAADGARPDVETANGESPRG